MAVDKTPPSVASPSWDGTEVGGGVHPLSFSAQDGSASAPQSGVSYIDVYVDGEWVYREQTKCPQPLAEHLIPSASCFGLSGTWSLHSEEYATGSHEITLRASDWAGNASQRTFKVTVHHDVGATHSLGPGTVNVLSGEYTLGASDVSLPAGAASLEISRSYSSQLKGELGPLGPGWTLSTPDGPAGGIWQGLLKKPSGNVEATTTGGEKVLFVKRDRATSRPCISNPTP